MPPPYLYAEIFLLNVEARIALKLLYGSSSNLHFSMQPWIVSLNKLSVSFGNYWRI